MKTQTIPVRLDRETAARAAQVAGRIGISRSAIVRLALANQLAEIDTGVIRLKKIPGSRMQTIELAAQ